jgi:hypothetical protein
MKAANLLKSARAGRFRQWPALAWSGALLLWACQEPPEEAPRAPAAQPGGRVLTEHRPLAAASPPSKSVGEDCTTYGQAECLSGLCLHVRPQRNAGYFCSQACRATEECPEGWRCARLMPGSPEAGVCQPPPGWVSAEAQLRTEASLGKPPIP